MSPVWAQLTAKIVTAVPVKDPISCEWNDWNEERADGLSLNHRVALATTITGEEHGGSKTIEGKCSPWSVVSGRVHAFLAKATKWTSGEARKRAIATIPRMIATHDQGIATGAARHKDFRSGNITYKAAHNLWLSYELALRRPPV